MASTEPCVTKRGMVSDIQGGEKQTTLRLRNTLLLMLGADFGVVLDWIFNFVCSMFRLFDADDFVSNIN